MGGLGRRSMARIGILGLMLAAGVAISTSGFASEPRHRPAAAVRPSAARVGQRSAQTAPVASRDRAGVHHYLYVFPDQAMYVYDIDHGYRLVAHLSLPGVDSIRGVAASPTTHLLYISYGGYGSPGSGGSLLAYDLLRNNVLWRRSYSVGVDSMAINRSGSLVYMPDGELSRDGVWNVIDAHSGSIIGRINGGRGPHNTVVGLSGRRVYLGGHNFPYLDVASSATDRVVKQIGPLRGGVRPFTVNGAETLAYTTATGYPGFQVSSIKTGHVLYTVGFGSRFGYHPTANSPSAPSHGISLSPNERELWVVDEPNSYVHVFDVSGVPSRAPRQIADIRLAHSFTGQEQGCSADCLREGWLLHSRSGCYVYVGDSGEVISTVTRRAVAFLEPLRNTRKFLEIDWSAGRPVSTTSRTGLGYVRNGSPTGGSGCR
jgi:DNA-binding beta-propeller fold protein YncE